MKTITHTGTLFYYDGPQVIVARDDGGMVYAGVRIDSDSKGDRFLLKAITEVSLRNFRDGIVDLRSLMLGDGGREWLLGNMSGDCYQVHDLIQRDDRLESTGFLPESGFFMPISDTLRLPHV